MTAVTRKDIARLTGVSTATVSYVVNNGPRPVAEETRQRVLKVVNELGYQPNIVARSLTTRRTLSIGFIIPDLLNPTHAAIAKSFEQGLQMAGYSTVLCNSDEMPDRELAYLRVLLSKQVDGMALTPTGANLPVLQSLVASGMPLVLIDREIPGLAVDSVLFSNECGAFEATRHLIELGHRHIGLLCLPIGSTPGRERHDGYRRALNEAGIEYNAALVRVGDFKQAGDAVAMSLLVATPRPTALFVTSNRLMRGVLSVIKQRGMAMPDDLAVCCFDDVGYYSYMTPSITAVSTSVEQFGSETARLLVERLRATDTGEPRVVRIPCSLIIRESTAGIRPPSDGPVSQPARYWLRDPQDPSAFENQK